MKIKFSNLGSIKETELDLRPLTVIIGPNNSNKTYIAYSIYGLWQLCMRWYDIPFNDDTFKLELKQEDERSWSLKIDNNLLDFFIRYFDKIARTFQGKALEIFFQDSSSKLFSETSFAMIIERQKVENAINQLNKAIFYVGYQDRNRIELNRENDVLFLKCPSEKYKIVEENINEIEKRIKEILILFVEKNIFNTVFPFPSERNAFINTYKILENRRYKMLKKIERETFIAGAERQIELFKEQSDIRYPQPVEDFLDFLADIDLENTKKIKRINSSDKNEFQKLADEIENKIQNKNKIDFQDTQLGGKEIKVLVKKGLEIDLYNASSSIKQLAPLILYLRFRASKGDFLVIDEPEMNLHPESQVKLLEALCILVHLGVRVLVTTHSPYIMAHLNNLVNGNHQNPEILKHQSSSLYLEDERAFLPMDQVSAYEIKNNKLVSLHDPDYGIRWDTLSDVSVDIQQKFFEIYESGQEKQEEREEPE